MRILTDEGVEVESYNANEYKVLDDEVLTHHKAIKGKPAKSHMELEWVDESNPSNKLWRRVIDSPAVPAKAAWDEVEKVQRLVPLTDAEKAERAAQKAADEAARAAAEAEAAERAALAEAIMETAALAAENTERIDIQEEAIVELAAIAAGEEA